MTHRKHNTRNHNNDDGAQAGERGALAKLRLLGWTALGSFAFEAWKWPWQGRDYGE